MSTTEYGRRRVAASHRLEPLACGHRDPWLCTCTCTCTATGHRVDVDVIATAARHLMAAMGVPGTGYDIEAVRALWRRGGDDARLAELINRFGGAA